MYITPLYKLGPLLITWFNVNSQLPRLSRTADTANHNCLIG